MANKPIRLSTVKARQLANRLRRKSSGGSRAVVVPSSYGYKRLMSEKDFLKVRRRAQRVQGIDLVSIDFAGYEVRFLVNSVSRPGLRHTVVIQFNEIPAETVVRSRTHDLAALMRATGLKIYCSCEAFLFWGYQYKAEHNNYAAFDMRVAYPHVRNPKLQGYCCKHLYAVLGVLASGTIMNSLAKKLKDYVSREQLDGIQRTVSDSLGSLKVFGE